MRLANSTAGGCSEPIQEGLQLGPRGRRAVTSGWKRTQPRDPAGKPSCGLCSSYRTVSPQPPAQLGCTGLSLQVRHTTLIGPEGGTGSVLTRVARVGFRAIFHCTGCADSPVTGVSWWHCLQVMLQKLLEEKRTKSPKNVPPLQTTILRKFWPPVSSPSLGDESLGSDVGMAREKGPDGPVSADIQAQPGR